MLKERSDQQKENICFSKRSLNFLMHKEYISNSSQGAVNLNFTFHKEQN